MNNPQLVWDLKAHSPSEQVCPSESEDAVGTRVAARPDNVGWARLGAGGTGAFIA